MKCYPISNLSSCRAVSWMFSLLQCSSPCETLLRPEQHLRRHDRRQRRRRTLWCLQFHLHRLHHVLGIVWETRQLTRLERKSLARARSGVWYGRDYAGPSPVCRSFLQEPERTKRLIATLYDTLCVRSTRPGVVDKQETKRNSRVLRAQE